MISLAGALPLEAGTPFYDPIYGVSTTYDIVYGSGNTFFGSMDFNLDLYQPRDIGQGSVPDLSPGIVMIHGGAFVSGNKADLAPVAELYASYGYTVTSIRYRLLGDWVPSTSGPADDFPFPYSIVASTVNAGIEDASTAMAWMREHVAEYDIDANHIAIGGGSAGAIISLLQAYNNPPAATAPQAVLSLVGTMYGTEDSIQADGPPALVVASSDDDVVPFNAPLGTVAVVDRMNEVGVYNEFYVQTGIGHDVDFNGTFDGQTLTEHSIEFLARFLGIEQRIDGDYDGDGIVSAADYSLWRDNLGGDSLVLSGNGSGAAVVVQADYALWKQNFGYSGTDTGAAIPEPSALLLLGSGLGVVSVGWRTGRTRPASHGRMQSTS